MGSEIKSICLNNEKVDEGIGIYYSVGYNGVTKIKECQVPGQMSMVDAWYVYKGNKLIAKVFRVDEVLYN